MARTTKNKGKKRSSASPSKNRKKSVTRKSGAAKNRRGAKRRTRAAATATASIRKNKRNSSATRRTRSSSYKKTKSGSAASGKRSQNPTTSNTTGHTIVRIMGQGQYKIDRATMAKVNEIDNEIVKIFDGKLLPSESGSVGDDDTNTRLQKMLSEMNSLIINNGEQLSATEIVPSEFIIPPADASLEETKELFQGEGIFPG